MRTSPARGRWAEDVAQRHLERLGYRCEARNVRLAGGEIDLVARRDDVLVFVEVKARRESGRAGEAVTADKRRRLGRAAAAWIARRGVPSGGCRFDVVTVEGRGDRTGVEHIPGAFDAPQRWGV
ncbi:MAG TPA: YraN family protein [bacterium]|nr:YraN family protein [bacterium]